MTVFIYPSPLSIEQWTSRIMSHHYLKLHHFCCLALGVIFLVAHMQSVMAEANTQAYPKSLTVKLRTLLEEKQFDTLNKLLHEYQLKTEADISNEENLFTAYGAFSINDFSFAKFFNAWVSKTPQQYQAYLARANYYYQLGWMSRGTKWSSETPKENIEKMNHYFNKAKKDIKRAMQLNKNSMIGYGLFILISKTQGKNKKATDAMNIALDINPSSYKIRKYYLGQLTPRWGGSYEEMLVFAQSQSHVTDNPRIKMLEGFVYSAIGDDYATNRQYNKAEEFYTQALTYGRNYQFLYLRGKNYFEQEKYPESLKDLSAAIDRFSESSSYYYWRSKVYTELGEYIKALTDIERAALLELNDEYIQNQKKFLSYQFSRQGYDLHKDQKNDEAIKLYTYAIRLTPEDSSLYFSRGTFFAEQHLLDAALKDVKMAIQLDPDEIKFYRYLDWILMQSKDWEQIIRYWNQYIERHPKNSKAYLERGGAYYHKRDMKSALKDAKKASDLGHPEGTRLYKRLKRNMELDSIK